MKINRNAADCGGAARWRAGDLFREPSDPPPFRPQRANLGRAELVANARGNDPSQPAGHGIAELPHCLRPRAVEHHVVWEGLQASALSYREIAHRAIRPAQHVLAPRNTVHARLQGLGGLVQRASRVASIGSGAGLEPVVMKAARRARCVFGIRKIGYRVAHGYGDRERSVRVDILVFDEARGSLNAYNVKRGNGSYDGGKRRIIYEELVRTQMLLAAYGRRIGLAPRTSHAHIIFYYGLLSLPPPIAIPGDDLDKHFQFSVREAIELVNAYFVARLSALIEQED